jgi:hypothetical protein
MPLLMTRSLSGSFWPNSRYSPDLAPYNFWYGIADIQGHATTIMKSIPEEDFQKCFEDWKHRLTKCIGAQGDYLEVTISV